MAIAAECPVCHSKQSVRNKICKCGADLDKEKKGRRVKYHIIYRVNGKQKWESVNSFDDLDGYSIEDAKKAEAKRKVQKAENRLMDIKPEAKMTFKELAEWYLGLEKVKAWSSFWRKEIALRKINAVFGDMIVSQIKPVDLENYQTKRKKEGFADKTIDDEIGEAGTMISKAFDNDIVGGDTLKTFKKVEKLLKRNSNARDRVLSPEEFDTLMDKAPKHLKGVLATGYYTGMRKGEVLNLTWDKVSLKERIISLEREDTKDDEPRNIPVCDELHKALASIPRAIHDNHVFFHKGKPIQSIRTLYIKTSTGYTPEGTEYAMKQNDLSHSRKRNLLLRRKLISVITFT